MLNITTRILEFNCKLRGAIKNYGECCCWIRSNGKAGIFNTGSGALNLSNSVW